VHRLLDGSVSDPMTVLSGRRAAQDPGASDPESSAHIRLKLPRVE
jgi:hypothetical protein